MSLNFIELCGLQKPLITKLLGEWIVQIRHKEKKKTWSWWTQAVVHKF